MHIYEKIAIAKGRKTGGKNFSPGNRANPGGRPALPGDIKEAKKLTHFELQRILTEFLHLDPVALKDRLQAPTATMLEGMVGAIILRAVKEGCATRLNFLFDRIVGKVKDEIEVTMPVPFILKKRDGEEIVMGVQTKVDE